MSRFKVGDCAVINGNSWGQYVGLEVRFTEVGLKLHKWEWLDGQEHPGLAKQTVNDRIFDPISIGPEPYEEFLR